MTTDWYVDGVGFDRPRPKEQAMKLDDFDLQPGESVEIPLESIPLLPQELEEHFKKAEPPRQGLSGIAAIFLDDPGQELTHFGPLLDSVYKRDVHIVLICLSKPDNIAPFVASMKVLGVASWNIWAWHEPPNPIEIERRAADFIESVGADYVFVLPEDTIVTRAATRTKPSVRQDAPTLYRLYSSGIAHNPVVYMTSREGYLKQMEIGKNAYGYTDIELISVATYVTDAAND